jgi:hypothetical protein
MKDNIKHRSSDDICVILLEGEHKSPGDPMLLQDDARHYRQKHGCSGFLFDIRKADIKGSITVIINASDVAVAAYPRYSFCN